MTLLSFILLELAKAAPVGLTSKKLAIRYTNSRGMLTSLPSAAGHVRRAIGAHREYFQRPSAKFYGHGAPVTLTEVGKAKAEEIAAALINFTPTEESSWPRQPG